jgi:hypothetical protein
LASTSASERVTKGNSTTLGVDLLEGNVELLSTVDGLGGESFVEFNDINVRDLDASTFSSDGDSVSRSNTHDTRRNTSNSRGNVLSNDGQVELFSGLALHEQYSGSTIRHLGGVTSSGETFFIECGLELSKRFGSDTSTNTIIALKDDFLLVTLLVGDSDLDGNDLSIEETSLLSGKSLLVGRSGESILLSTSNIEFLSNVLRGDTGKYRLA